MTQYILKISSWAGTVPGASHFYGRVEGPRPRPCCPGPEHHSGGKVTCDQGHELPGRAEWDVEARWTPEQWDRYAAAGFDGEGPAAFRTKAAVQAAAVARFTGAIQPDPAIWWEHGVTPGRPGDELWYGWVARPQDAHMTDPADRWGMMLAQVTMWDVILPDLAAHPAASATEIARRLGYRSAEASRQVYWALVTAEQQGKAQRTRSAPTRPWRWETTPATASAGPVPHPALAGQETGGGGPGAVG